MTGYDASAPRPAPETGKVFHDRMPESLAVAPIVLAYAAEPAALRSPVVADRFATKGDRLSPPAASGDGRRADREIPNADVPAAPAASR